MSKKSKSAEFAESGYDITVTGRNVQVTDAMKDYALEKVSKIDRFTNRVIQALVIMDIQKLEQRVEIILKTDNIKIMSHAVSDNMYASIDQATAKLQRQLVRYKQRIQEHQAKGVPTIDMKVNVVRPTSEEQILEINGAIEEESRKRLIEKYRPHNIVSEETIPLKVLSYDEAIMKMELSQDAFLIFKGEEDRKLKVIYRRKDGDFGIIEPES